MSPSTAGGKRRRRGLRRAAPIAVLALVSFALGLFAAREDGAPTPGERFAAAWVRDDLDAMYAELAPESRDAHPERRFRRLYREAARTATLESLSAESAGEAERDGVTVEVIETTVDTVAFGQVEGELELPVVEDGIDWGPHLVFPGLERGEALSRDTEAPERAPILAADGDVLAEGEAGSRNLPATGAAAAVVGEVGAPDAGAARRLEARGFPPGSPAGVSGIELAYDDRLAGTPGGELLAGVDPAEDPGEARTLASSEAQPGRPVRTTIDVAVQEAAVSALGGLFGGIAVLDARRGAVRGLAGIAFTAPQPPGSTFKVITAVGALDEGVVEPEEQFPVETVNTEIGREIRNSGESACGGTFIESFAQSCNTVFAPLGVRLGEEALVELSERFGFNDPPALHGAQATATIDPPASTIPAELANDVEVGVSAIGQGRVLATPLQMASVAQTIANEGVRMPTRLVSGPLAPDAEPVTVTSEETAATLRQMMIAVVRDGTGTAAALPHGQVAGKTGTAELGPEPATGELAAQELNAWFIGFAPAGDPELAVAVMVVNAQGDGGEIAAPIARRVLADALEAAG